MRVKGFVQESPRIRESQNKYRFYTDIETPMITSFARSILFCYEDVCERRFAELFETFSEKTEKFMLQPIGHGS